MKLSFAGVGNAFASPDLWQSNIILSEDNSNLLLDCGSDIRHSIKEQIKNINNGNIHENILGTYISHVHADHIGGLEWLGFCTYFNPKAPKPLLIFHQDIEKEIWKEYLKGTMKQVQNHSEMKLENYFNVKILKNKSGFYFKKIKCMPIKSIHVPSIHPKLSFGLFIHGNKLKTYWTSDCIFNPKNPEYENADIILHDCETTEYSSGVHPHYEQLKTLDEKIKNKMWLYHYSPEFSKFNPKKDGFQGFVEKGQTFEI